VEIARCRRQIGMPEDIADGLGPYLSEHLGAEGVPTRFAEVTERHSSFGGSPLSACARICAICSVENLDFRMPSLPVPSLELSSFARRRFRGSGQIRLPYPICSRMHCWKVESVVDTNLSHLARRR
jgi:hypothetical protein